MTTEKGTFVRVLQKYLHYAEAFSQYNQLYEEDKRVIKPYIDHLKQDWEDELKQIRRRLLFLFHIR